MIEKYKYQIFASQLKQKGYEYLGERLSQEICALPDPPLPLEEQEKITKSTQEKRKKDRLGLLNSSLSRNATEYKNKEISGSTYFKKVKLSSRYMEENLEDFSNFLDQIEKLDREFRKPPHTLDIHDIRDLFTQTEKYRQYAFESLQSKVLSYKEVEDFLSFFDEIWQDSAKLQEAYSNKSSLDSSQTKALYQALLYGQSANLVPNLLLDLDLVWRKLGENIQRRISLEEKN